MDSSNDPNTAIQASSAPAAAASQTSRRGGQTGSQTAPLPTSRKLGLALARSAAASDIAVPSGSVPELASPLNHGVADAHISAPIAQPSKGTPKQVIVPDGTVLAVQLSESLSSELNRAGDTFSARLVAPIMVGNQIAIPANAIVQGEIVEVRNAGHFSGSSELVAKVTRLEYNGKTYRLRSSEYSQKTAARSIQTAEIIGGSAGVGAILGAILGGKKGTAIGAVLGAGVGTGARVMSKPKQIELPAQSTLSFRLETPITVTTFPVRG
jgi:hypothetical protein